MSLSMQTFALVKDRALSMDMCNGNGKGTGHRARGHLLIRYPIVKIFAIVRCGAGDGPRAEAEGRAHVTCATPRARAS